MDRKKSRLSLSRKRKKSAANDISDVISAESDSKRNFLEDGQVFQDTDENSSSGKNPESSKDVSRKETHYKSSKKGITTWLKTPCSPKTVPCPMCGRVVLLSKINQHLDSNCESDTNSKVVDHTEKIKSKAHCEGNRLLGSAVQKDVKEKDLAPVIDGSTKKLRDCKSDNLVPLKTSSNSVSNTGVISLGKMSRRPEKIKLSVANLNDCYNVACSDIIAQNNSSGTCNGITRGDSLGKRSSAYYAPDESAKELKDYFVDGNIRESNQEMPTSEDLHVSKLPTNCVNDVEEHTYKEESTVENSESQGQEQKDHEPYYLANFKLVLTNVLSNQDDGELFNEQDNAIIDSFNEMSPEEQKLYIRLFQRKRGWFKCSKLEYPKISRNLKPVLDSLIQKGFLEDEHQLTNLRETLNLIAAPELKLLVKSLHVSAGQKGNTKEDTIDSIVSHAENQKTLFGSFRSVVLKRAKQALGSCVRLAADPRDVFCRSLLLFTMNVIPDDEDTTNNGQAQQLSTLFLANIGKVVYPAYVIDRPTPVFHSRDSLIAFADAYQQKHEMFMALESNRFEQAYSYYPEASKKFDNILAKLKDDSKIPASILPEHLRCFTAEWAITKMCYFGVEVLQKWRRYDDAVNQLESLLRQDVFCFDSRGCWYDRLALNLHQHLKRPEQAMEVIRQGLSDPHVRFGRRLALIQRAKRILSSPAFQKGKKKKCEDFADLVLQEPSPSKSITISGTRCAQLGVFIAPEIDQDGEVIHGTTTFCAVEEYALSYYRQQGFDQGIHGEGSTFSSLFCLFMWDIIFSSGIRDVFRSPFQAAPLDMCFDSFYTSRKEIIDKRLEEVRSTPVEKIQEMLSKSWNDNEGQICSGLSWERFTNVEQAKQLVACLGGTVLSGIFTRFAQGYRYHRSGLPDLVVWNSSTLDYRIAEVKGPGDRLSTKQQIWLEVLESLGANVEVCYVTDIGAKRLKVSK